MIARWLSALARSGNSEGRLAFGSTQLIASARVDHHVDAALRGVDGSDGGSYLRSVPLRLQLTAGPRA
jgi:hypothetical protein